jgi:hypothetical protein
MPATDPPSASVPASAGSTGSTVAVEPSLLRHVPATDDGIALTFDPETTGSVVADPALGRDASALAIGIAAASGSSGSTDLVVVSVVRARVAEITDDWFRNYRDSFDTAACAQAGAVSGHAEATIDDRQVFIGTCAGGAFTYHVRLANEPIIVSAVSVGPRRLGEKVMEGVTP